MYRARYRRIVFFFGRVILSLGFWDLLLPRLGLHSLSQRTRSKRLSAAAVQFRGMAIRMGGVLIKVGQFLSARVDVLPKEITQELTGLQDEVPEESFEDILRVIEAEFGMALADKFLELNARPEAAASLGQVHQAKIYRDQARRESDPGDNPECEVIDVVVKVQRPHIEEIISTDLAALRTVGNWLKRYRPINRRANVPALLNEFTRILYEEIDYLAEGRNAETFAVNFTDRPGVRVPEIFWTHTTKRVLTLEDVRAIKITDYAGITAAGLDRVEVADRLFQTYLQQIFEDGFFHADPHPGNLFVRPMGNGSGQVTQELPLDRAEQQDWQLTFVDFGMVGRVPPKLLAAMRELAIAVGTRDPARVVKAYQMMGILLPNADLSLLERAEAMAFERFWGKSMGELREISPEEIRAFSSEFRELIYTLPFQIPEDLILLGRCVGILSGMCTGLNPDFNVWEGLSPFAQKLIAEEASANRGDWLEELGILARTFVTYPRRVESALDKLERGDLTMHDPKLTRQVKGLEQALSRAAGAVIFASLLLGGVQLYLGGATTVAYALFGGAVLTLAWILLTSRRYLG